MLSEDVSAAPLPKHYHISARKLYITSLKNDATCLSSAVSSVVLNKALCSIFAAEKHRYFLASMFELSTSSCEGGSVIQF